MSRFSLFAPVCPCCGNSVVVLLSVDLGKVVVECHACCLLRVVEIDERAPA